MAPKHAKIHGSIAAVTARSPVLGGQFAVWGGLFACCDSLAVIVLLRRYGRKKILGTSIISGAVTGGVLAARAGPKQMASAALVGGVLLPALIEGMGIMFSRIMAPPVPTAEDYAQAARDVTLPPTAGGLFGGGGSGFLTFGSSPSSAPPPPSSLDPE
jgi:mitochondrial import inner membrane translocase subunit TIM17